VWSTGFSRRLGQEIHQVAQSNPRYQELSSVLAGQGLCIVRDQLCPPNIAAWVGGSILTLLEVCGAQEVDSNAGSRWRKAHCRRSGQETMDLSLFLTRNAYQGTNRGKLPDWLSVGQGPGAIPIISASPRGQSL
jgi:hypothetical protein